MSNHEGYCNQKYENTWIDQPDFRDRFSDSYHHAFLQIYRTESGTDHTHLQHHDLQHVPLRIADFRTSGYRRKEKIDVHFGGMQRDICSDDIALSKPSRIRHSGILRRIIWEFPERDRTSIPGRESEDTLKRERIRKTYRKIHVLRRIGSTHHAAHSIRNIEALR